MSTHETEATNPMDGIEALVRTRFESTVGNIELDVPSLVTAGTTSGLRMRRNQRLIRGSVVVASVAVLAAVAGVGLSGGLLSDSAPPAKQVEVQKLVPSNPRAFFGIAVIADLPPGINMDSGQPERPLPRARASVTRSAALVGHPPVLQPHDRGTHYRRRAYPVNFVAATRENARGCPTWWRQGASGGDLRLQRAACGGDRPAVGRLPGPERIGCLAATRSGPGAVSVAHQDPPRSGGRHVHLRALPSPAGSPLP